LRVCSGPQRER
jgi:hypothetical protein